MPVTFRAVRTAKRTRTKRAALSTRISFVLGFTNRQTKSQIETISSIRKIKDIISPNMEILYPILTVQVKRYFPILTENIPYIHQADTNSSLWQPKKMTPFSLIYGNSTFLFLDVDTLFIGRSFCELTSSLIDFDCHFQKNADGNTFRNGVEVLWVVELEENCWKRL